MLYEEFLEMFEEIKILCKTREEFGEVPMSPILHFTHILDMGWRVEKHCFLRLVFEPIWKQCNTPEDIYSWIAEKRLGVGVFWSNDEIWDWLHQPQSDYISKEDAAILFKNIKNFIAA